MKYGRERIRLTCRADGKSIRSIPPESVRNHEPTYNARITISAKTSLWHVALITKKVKALETQNDSESKH